jgi:hypothetical protein
MILGPWLRGHKQHISFSDVHRTLNQYVKADQGMDQPVIVVYLSLKGLSARTIHEELRVTLRLDAVAYSTVARYLHDTHCSPSIAETALIEVQRRLDDSNHAILSAFETNLFVSVR